MMRTFITLLFVIVSIAANSQEMPDTVLYNDDTICNNNLGTEQDLIIDLQNDTLFINGYIKANCCGHHFLIVEKPADSVLLTRLDTGYLCDCTCPLEIGLALEGFTADSYHLILKPYFTGGSFGIDTVIHQSTSAIPIAKSRKNQVNVYPNPTTGKIFLKTVRNRVENVIVSNLIGQKQKIKPVGQQNIAIDLTGYPDGIYILEISTAQGTQVVKIIKSHDPY